MTGYVDYLIQSDLEFISELEQDFINDFEDFNESFSGIDDEINAHEFDDEWANELEPGYNFLQDEYDFVYPENNWDEPYEFEDLEEFDVETERISDNERRILQLAGLNENDLLEAMLDAEHQDFDDLSQHRGKPGMKLNKKSYGGRFGKYAKKYGEKSVKHSKKAQNAANKVSKTYHKVAARINKAKQSAYADHGKKDYTPGYRSAKYFKTLTTGRY